MLRRAAGWGIATIEGEALAGRQVKYGKGVRLHDILCLRFKID